MPAIVTTGIDLAKSAFAVHGVEAADKPVPVRSSVPTAEWGNRHRHHREHRGATVSR